MKAAARPRMRQMDLPPPPPSPRTLTCGAACGRASPPGCHVTSMQLRSDRGAIGQGWGSTGRLAA